MIELNNENFDKEVTQADGPVLVDFWGIRCEPCKALMPEIEKLAEKYRGKIKICKLNTTENRRLAISQRVMGLPTFIVYKNGNKIKEISGAGNCTVAAIENIIEENI